MIQETISLIAAIIAILTFVYSRKKWKVLKEQVMRKRYLENALSNLKTVINSLSSIRLPKLEDTHLPDELVDTYTDAYVLASNIVIAGYELKKKKFVLDVSYFASLVQTSENLKRFRRINNIAEYDVDRFIDLIESESFITIYSKTKIEGYEPFFSNEISFIDFTRILRLLIHVKNNLVAYAEIYEILSPNLMNKIDQLIKEIAEEILKACKAKKIEINLEEFSSTHDIARYLLDEYLNYNSLERIVSKISGITSELSDMSKQLFLKL